MEAPSTHRLPLPLSISSVKGDSSNSSLTDSKSSSLLPLIVFSASIAAAAGGPARPGKARFVVGRVPAARRTALLIRLGEMISVHIRCSTLILPRRGGRRGRGPAVSLLAPTPPWGTNAALITSSTPTWARLQGTFVIQIAYSSILSSFEALSAASSAPGSVPTPPPAQHQPAAAGGRPACCCWQRKHDQKHQQRLIEHQELHLPLSTTGEGEPETPAITPGTLLCLLEPPTLAAAVVEAAEAAAIEAAAIAGNLR